MKYGTCKICGFEGELSYEHIPPKKAFNNKTFYTLTNEEVLKLDRSCDFSTEAIKKQKLGQIKQGGIGRHTICHKCNNNTGSWYGSDYVNWVHQVMYILLKANGKPTLYYPTFFYPLRVIKQIFTMFFSVNYDGFRLDHPELVKFILNKESRFLSPRYKVYVYYNIVGFNRYLGYSIIGDIAKRTNYKLSEITFPPLGFVMTIDSDRPDKRLADISFFSKYKYNDWTDFYQRYNVLPTHLPHIAADYRTKGEIDRDILKSKLEMNNLDPK